MKSAKEILKTYKINKQYQRELKKEYDSFKFESKEKMLIFQELKNVNSEIDKIEASIMSLKQPSKSILIFRYIKNMSYEHIALKLNYSTQRIYQLLRVALNEFKSEYERRSFGNAD